jgi:outer membrane beta-barrel protein
MKRTLKPALAALVMLAGARPAVAATEAADAETDKADDTDKTDRSPEPAPPNVEGGDPCIDEDVKADLFAKRRQRTSRDRLFQQTNRHELSMRSGYYSSDTFDGVGYIVHHPLGVPVPTFGVFAVSYAYHMTEDLAVEATAGLTRLTSHGGPELERTFAVLEGKPRRQLMFDANLVWSIAHAKLRLGGSITHFDFYVTGGGGVVDSALSSGIAGNGGFGLKFFLGRAFGLRFDVRDHVFQQQLLSQSLVVNDVTATVGFSIYLPMRE